MPIFSLRKMRWRQSSHETRIELTAHYSCILHKSIGRLKHNPTEIVKLEFIYEMTKSKVKRLKSGLQVIRLILQKLCLSEL